MRSYALLAAVAATGVVAAPAAAQTAYPYPSYQQPAYPGYDQAYPQAGYGQRGYAQSPIGQIIDGLLGNRYNVTDRQAVSQCASAAMTQASAQYGNGYNRAYGQQGYGQGYNGYAAPAMRVTAITDVQRRSSGLRVKGLMSSGYGGQYGSQYGSQYGGQYGGQYGYQNRNYTGGDLTFRCNVDYRGAVTNIKIARNDTGYRHY